MSVVSLACDPSGMARADSLDVLIAFSFAARSELSGLVASWSVVRGEAVLAALEPGMPGSSDTEHSRLCTEFARSASC